MFHKIDMMLLSAKSFLASKIRDERGDVNVVSIVVLIAVAVVLAVLLKDALKTLITSLIGKITGQTDKVFS